MALASAIKASERGQYADYFQHLRMLPSTVQSALQGNCGALYVAASKTAWIWAPPFVFPVGPVNTAAAQQLLTAIGQDGGIIVASETWYDKIERAFSPRSKRHNRTQYQTQTVTNPHFSDERQQHSCQSSQIKVKPIDLPLTEEVTTAISPDLIPPTSFPDNKSFAANGLGYCVLINTAPVAAATSAFISNSSIEIQVNTHAAFRNRGFAALACKALITESIKQGLRPDWDTEDPLSDRLARSLGYTKLRDYPVLSITPKPS